MATTLQTPATESLVGIGQVVFLSEQGIARAVLGSCVGVVLHDAGSGLGALAHVVLPASNGRSGPEGKYADTAIRWMRDELVGRGAKANRLIAKITGGATMFTGTGPFRIGEANAAAVIEQLNAFGIRLAARDLGGTQGRRVSFDIASGMLVVELAGQSPKTY
jgi:chemotaxis protein CheD